MEDILNELRNLSHLLCMQGLDGEFTIGVNDYEFDRLFNHVAAGVRSDFRVTRDQVRTGQFSWFKIAGPGGYIKVRRLKYRSRG